MRDRGAAEAVRGQHHRPGRAAYGGPDAFDPVGLPGRLPVLLLDAAGVLALALPVRLPVVRGWSSGSQGQRARPPAFVRPCILQMLSVSGLIRPTAPSI